MTELEKTGLLILFLVLIGVLIWGIVMIHDDLARLSIKLENIVKRGRDKNGSKCFNNECTNE